MNPNATFGPAPINFGTRPRNRARGPSFLSKDESSLKPETGMWSGAACILTLRTSKGEAKKTQAAAATLDETRSCNNEASL